MKARQLFTASLGLALLALIVWMIMSNGEPQTDGLQANTFSNPSNDQAPAELIDSEINLNESEDKRVIAQNSDKKSQELQSPVQPPQSSKFLKAGNKPGIPSRPPDITTEEYLRKNHVLLEKIGRNYQRILDKKRGN